MHPWRVEECPAWPGKSSGWIQKMIWFLYSKNPPRSLSLWTKWIILHSYQWIDLLSLHLTLELFYSCSFIFTHDLLMKNTNKSHKTFISLSMKRGFDRNHVTCTKSYRISSKRPMATPPKTPWFPKSQTSWRRVFVRGKNFVRCFLTAKKKTVSGAGWNSVFGGRMMKTRWCLFK